MIMDVAISSCGRIDALEQTILSLQKYIKFSGKFRFIIVEDLLKGDKEKRIVGRDIWLKEHADLFDVIHYNTRQQGIVYHLTDIIPFLKSDLFFRLDDDTPFIENIDIDPIIEFLNNSDNICEAIFRKENHRFTGKKKEFVIDNPPRTLVTNEFYSVATGILKLDWAKKFVNAANGLCHETTSLTPQMIKMGQTSVVINGISQLRSRDDLGDKLGYKKGSWK